MVSWARNEAKADTKRVAVLGFCYGGGKALRYTTQARPSAATVVYYGRPLTDPSELAPLQAPVPYTWRIETSAEVAPVPFAALTPPETHAR